ncbi:uncharacterized protein LOC143225995 isoform X1 [Tachypleus tridentatus]|uniref:uncharacterized protein LOC143225995 isoform X1 n=1 Tax=Tachypleus tridentatus TaxID=6853 RepID=UPI003FD417AE
MNVLPTVFFILESFHFWGHLTVLLGWRLLPRKDLVRQFPYFISDTLTVFLSYFFIIQQLQWLAVLQIIEHVLVVCTWEKHYWTKKVVSWSSLDWTGSRMVPDIWLSTFFDVAVHGIDAVILATMISLQEVMLSCLLTGVAFCAVFFNSKFAWSNPKSVPQWVAKRIQPCEKY